jgi:hypothetical protein
MAKMTINLDYTQRINLHGMLGAQAPPNVAGLRAIWKLQDKISLTSEEEKSIGLTRRAVNGQEIMEWRPTYTSGAAPYEFTDSEAALLKGMLEARPPNPATRVWLEPILDALVPI